MLDTIKREIIEQLNNIYSDKIISIQEVVKNNGVVKTGVTIKSNDSNIAPVIYINPVFENDVYAAVREIVSIYENSSNSYPGYETIFDYKYAKDNLRIKLINKEFNKSSLETWIYRDFLDLIIVPIISLDNYAATVTVNHNIANMWGIDADTIIDISINNTLKENVAIHDISHFIPVDIDEISMYVIGGREAYGARHMIDEKIFSNLAKELGSDLIIIPSSTEELIVIPKINECEEFTNEIIKEVNHNELSPEEILSDHYYIYSRSEGWIY